MKRPEKNFKVWENASKNVNVTQCVSKTLSVTQCEVKLLMKSSETPKMIICSWANIEKSFVKIFQGLQENHIGLFNRTNS